MKWAWVARDGARWRPVNFFRMHYLDDLLEKQALPRTEETFQGTVAGTRKGGRR